jgi:hypothetical protein
MLDTSPVRSDTGPSHLVPVVLAGILSWVFVFFVVAFLLFIHRSC